MDTSNGRETTLRVTTGLPSRGEGGAPSSVGRWMLLVAAALATATAGRAGVELAAVMQVGGRTEFVLEDKEDHATSEWLALGQSFHDFRLQTYDARREVLTVRNGEQTLELPLKGSHARPLTRQLPPELAERGLTPGDLSVRDTGPVRITLSVGAAGERRFIDVEFDNGTDRASVEFGADGPTSIARSFVPEAVRGSVTDDDIAAINAHLVTVREKWMR